MGKITENTLNTTLKQVAYAVLATYILLIDPPIILWLLLSSVDIHNKPEPTFHILHCTILQCWCNLISLLEMSIVQIGQGHILN